MNKNDKIRTARVEYIKQRINDTRNTAKEIKKLAKELFLSERTIERDLKK